ncbi:MAG TPA: glutamine--fructose-6-phosphate transaminase (isomerizing) [Candidatus Paceibacterota bacterium]
MCGIAGYIGKKGGLKKITVCLSRLEYRGYDSAGVLFFEKGLARLEKSIGKMDKLERKLENSNSDTLSASIGHTRWATHGVPSESNAHPHHDCYKKIFLVHNGIIENFSELKTQLIKSGHKFTSETDTEVIVHLLEKYHKLTRNFSKALDLTLKKIVGAYALGIINTDEPDKIYFAKLGSPLIVGLGKDEYYLASDPAALAGMAQKIIYLKDGQRGWISPKEFKIWPAKPTIEKLNIKARSAQKSGFAHFMLKEIFEQPESLKNSLRGRISKNGSVKLGGLEATAKKISKIKNLEIIACGTSYHAGLIGKLLFEEMANIPTSVSLASEQRYQKNATRPNTAHLFISQSGETADTLAALKKIKPESLITLGLVNMVGSSIARETEAGVYNHAGPEIGVASTKAFTSQVAILTLMAAHFSPKNKSNKSIISELTKIPEKIKKILEKNDQIKKLAEKYSDSPNLIFIGRKYNYPTALEGALKLKEISYAHAEGTAAGELKHGMLALIEPDFPVIAIANQNNIQEKTISNMLEIKARNGLIIAITTEGDKNIASIADDVIYVPKTAEQLEPLLNSVALQLFAYHFGVSLGHDVDRPRNLAKSVTVE